MSTLTSSPSPAASPRSSFHIQRSNYSPYSFSSLSPKQRPRPTPPTYPSATSGAKPKQPKEHQVEGAGAEKAGRYADAGTQYSPDGYPPTAIRASKGKEKEQHGSPPSSAKKRKERASPQPMNTSGSSAASSTQSLRPPAEPEPRRDPTPVHPQSSENAVAGSSTQPEPEPQEARSTHGLSSAPKRSKPEPGSVKVMPVLLQDSNPKELGVLISSMLMELIRLNDQIPLRDGRLTRFHSRAPPGISVSDYLQRLIHHATLSPPILLSMVWYIDRLCQLYPIFTINSLTVHRFLITAATVAAKGLSDSFWRNGVYARIGGIPVSELATLELEFLDKVQWKIVPKPETLEDYYRSLVERTEGYEMEIEEGSESESSGESEEGQKDADEKMVDEPT